MTPKHARFVGQYLIHGNATLAAKEAGCPEASAYSTGGRWLKNPQVAAAIAEGQARLARGAQMTAEQVIEELTKVARYDPRALYDEDGNRIPVHQLDCNTRMAVSSVEDETRTMPATEDRPEVVIRVQKLKMADKLRALELLGKRHKLWTDKSELCTGLRMCLTENCRVKSTASRDGSDLRETLESLRRLEQLSGELARREARRKLFTYYPENGPLRRQLYAEHLEFFRAGAQYRERLMLAANRIGKTEGVRRRRDDAAT